MIRFEHPEPVRVPYVVLTVTLPLLLLAVRGAGARVRRALIGLGSDEFRRVFNAAMGLTAAIAIVSYITRSDIARGYVLVALPCATVMDLTARYALRKRLHRQRRVRERSCAG